MENMAIQAAKDLDIPAREWLQHLFGRPLREDEQITILTFPPHPAPPAKGRREAFKRMNRVLDKAAENMKDVPDSGFDDAVDEAMEHVRKRPT